ncbi:general substrate transporter [Mycena sanguinolenta]|nr:general substrate transporter [Mycena sanguinolenta]
MDEKSLTLEPELEHKSTQQGADYVLDTDLALALSTGPQLRRFSANAFRLYFVLFVASMGSLSFGFDITVMSSVNGMVQFTDYFGISGGDTGGGQGAVVAMLYNVFTFGRIAGSLVAGPMADRWGRRGGMFIASIIILAGVLLVTAAQNRTYLFVGRFAIVGGALNITAAPAYVSEFAPPQWRGCITGLSSCFWFIGSVVCSGLAIGTGRINSSWSWRMPLAVQFVPTIVLVIGVCFIPESPRWLMSVGRKDETHVVLAKYHGNGDSDAPLVLLELRELGESIKTDGSNKRWRDHFNYSELFKSRSARYRTLLTSWMATCCLWSGLGVFTYVTVAFDLVGVKMQQGRLIFSWLATVVGALGGIFGAFIIDKVGRRSLWLWGTASCAVTLAMVAGFTAKTQTPGAIACILIFSFVQNMTYTPLQRVPRRMFEFCYKVEGVGAVKKHNAIWFSSPF